MEYALLQKCFLLSFFVKGLRFHLLLLLDLSFPYSFGAMNLCSTESYRNTYPVPSGLASNLLDNHLQ